MSKGVVLPTKRKGVFPVLSIGLCQKSSLFFMSVAFVFKYASVAHCLLQHRHLQLLHCFTPPHFQGHGYAAVLARVVFEACFVAGVVVHPVCSYLLHTFLPKHSHLLAPHRQVVSCLLTPPERAGTHDTSMKTVP